MKRVHVLMSGRVQGVFFRAFVKQHADELRIRGYVQNTRDKVEAVFEGQEENIEKMLKLCRKGPPLARTENVEVKQEPFIGEFSDFRIVY